MKTLVVTSDLHLEFGAKMKPEQLPKANYLALCGDIGVGVAHREFVERLVASKRWDTVFILHGNHEYYNKVVEDIEIRWRKIAAEYTNNELVFLDGTETYVMGDYLFAGCTLWSDLSDVVASNMATYYMNDYKLIRSIQSFSPQTDDWLERTEAFDLDNVQTWGYMPSCPTQYVDGNFAKPRGITTQLTTFWHKKDVAYLEFATQEAERLGKKLVVFTHHTPNKVCLSPKHSGNSLDPAYFTDLTHLMEKTHIWGCGHTHSRIDTVVNGCRLLMGCRGYVHGSTNESELPPLNLKAVDME